MGVGDSAASRVSRREMMTLAGTGIVGAAAIGGGSMVLSDNARATMQVETENLKVSSPDGTVEEIVVNLSADCSYSNAEDVTFVGFDTTLNGQTIHSLVSSIDSPIFSPGELGPTSGDFTYRTGIEQNNPGTHLFQQTDFEPGDFEVPEEGESETFDLDFETELRVLTGSDPSSTEIVATSTSSAPMQLTITNEEGSEETEMSISDMTISYSVEGAEEV